MSLAVNSSRLILSERLCPVMVVDYDAVGIVAFWGNAKVSKNSEIQRLGDII